MKDKCTENFKCRTLGTSVSVLSRFQNADFLLCNSKILFKLQVFQLRLDCSKIKTMVIDETLDQNGQHLLICVHFVLIGSCHTENIAQSAAYHCLLFTVRLQRTRAESSLSVPGPGEANKEKLHDLEFNFGKLLLLLLVLCQILNWKPEREFSFICCVQFLLFFVNFLHFHEVGLLFSVLSILYNHSYKLTPFKRKSH